MFLIDDILCSPMKGMFYIFNQINKAAEEEFLNEENISVQLSELYMMLETGKITEEEFDKKESVLLDRLDQIEEYKKKHFGAAEESVEEMPLKAVIKTERKKKRRVSNKELRHTDKN